MSGRIVDELGRVVLPIEFRRELNIDSKDIVDMYLKDNGIFITKSIESCIFCSSIDRLRKYNNKSVCDECLQKFTDISIGEEVGN